MPDVNKNYNGLCLVGLFQEVCNVSFYDHLAYSGIVVAKKIRKIRAINARDLYSKKLTAESFLWLRYSAEKFRAIKNGTVHYSNEVKLSLFH